MTAAQATGDWSFTLQRTTTFACTSALASGQVITGHVDVLTDGALSTASSWLNPLNAAVEPMGGAVALSNGVADFTLSVSSTTGMELTGTMSAGGSFTGGALRDPASGFFQVFGTDGCQYSVTGVKTS